MNNDTHSHRNQVDMSALHLRNGSTTTTTYQQVQAYDEREELTGRVVNDFLNQFALKQMSGSDEEMHQDNENHDDEEEDAVLTGFRFCAEEAIRFLTEEEHFSPTDPIILELKQHLQEQQVRFLQQQKEQEKSSGDDDSNSEEQKEQPSKETASSSSNEMNRTDTLNNPTDETTTKCYGQL